MNNKEIKEKLFYQKAKDYGTLESIEEYLTKYPNGKYVKELLLFKQRLAFFNEIDNFLSIRENMKRYKYIFVFIVSYISSLIVVYFHEDILNKISLFIIGNIFISILLSIYTLFFQRLIQIFISMCFSSYSFILSLEYLANIKNKFGFISLEFLKKEIIDIDKLEKEILVYEFITIFFAYIISITSYYMFFNEGKFFGFLVWFVFILFLIKSKIEEDVQNTQSDYYNLDKILILKKIQEPYLKACLLKKNILNLLLIIEYLILVSYYSNNIGDTNFLFVIPIGFLFYWSIKFLRNFLIDKIFDITKNLLFPKNIRDILKLLNKLKFIKLNITKEEYYNYKSFVNKIIKDNIFVVSVKKEYLGEGTTAYSLLLLKNAYDIINYKELDKITIFELITNYKKLFLFFRVLDFIELLFQTIIVMVFCYICQNLL